MRLLLAFPFGLLALTACAAGTAARAVRPDAPTARHATGDAGLVIDWPAHARAELEATLRERQLLLVRRDADGGVTLLPECRAWGEVQWNASHEAGYARARGYENQTFSPKSEVIEMRDADAISAQLPRGASSLVARFEAELNRGARLELALVSRARLQAVGSEALYRTQLGNRAGRRTNAPECSGATHFVRAVSLGAFAMSTNTNAALRSAAEVFGAGAEAESNSDKRVHVRDGDLQACDDKDAPQCSVPLRIELGPVDPRDHRAVACGERRPDACVEWLRESLSAAERNSDGADEARRAFTMLRDSCRQAETRGSMMGTQSGACEALLSHRGLVQERLSITVPESELDAAATQGCAVALGASCARLATAADARGDLEEAARLHFRPCERALATGRDETACFYALQYAKEHQRKPSAALAHAFAFQCSREASACSEFARYAGPLEPTLAAELHPRAEAIIAQCKRDVDPATCRHAAALHGYGLGVPKDPRAARAAWRAQCESVERTGAACGKSPW